MTALGPFQVVATAEEAAAFCAATGTEPTEMLPLTFPMRWLAAPAVRAAMLDLAGDAVLVHESQSFSYGSRLHPDRPYRLTLRARRDHAPERLVVEGTLADESGAEQASLETVLRLVPFLPETGA